MVDRVMNEEASNPNSETLRKPFILTILQLALLKGGGNPSHDFVGLKS